MIQDAQGHSLVLPPPPEPALRQVLEALSGAALPLRHDPGRAGVDLLCLQPTAAGPNRARVKVFAPAAGVVLAFLYKDSQVPGSTDRFSYGALLLKNRLPGEEELAALVAYLASGLRPDHRPPGLKRTFPFTVPR